MKYLWKAALLLLVVACAKRTEESYSDIELRSMEAWRERNAPDAEKLERGLYIKRVEMHNDAAKPMLDSCWVSLDYTCTDMLTGNVYFTRTKSIAELALGSTAITRTHYVPELLPFTTYSYTTLPAIQKALPTMHLGDSVIIYAHSDHTFGSSQSSYSGGYQGAADHIFPGDVPSIIYLKLKEIIKDPQERERLMVEKYAADKLGLAVTDTIATHQYLKITVDNPGDSVKEAETLYLYYVTSFLDGFVADTNIDSVALRVWNVYPGYAATTYTVSSESTSMIKAVYNAVTKMRYGDWGETVFTSDYAYGGTGMYTTTTSSGTTTSAIPVIQSYEPLVMRIYVVKQETTTSE